MIQSTLSRFDNAPAHLIILSPRFNTRETGAGYQTKEKPWVDPVVKAAADEKKYQEHQAKLKVAADIRKARESIERLQKMELSRRHQREAKAKRASDKRVEVFLDTTPAKRETWIKAYPPIPCKKLHSKKQRGIETIRERERRARIRAERMIDMLPEGYVQAQSVPVAISQHGVYLALRDGRVKAVKIGTKWYCNPTELTDYCTQARVRRLAGLAASRAKILEARRQKREQCHTGK